MNRSLYLQKTSSMPTIQENINRSIRSHKSVNSRLARNNYYKNEQMFNQLSIIEKDDNSPSSSLRNDCPGGEECKNYLQIQSLNSKLQQYQNTIDDLSNLNNFFIYTLYQKDNMYRTLLQENKFMKHGKMLIHEKELDSSHKTIRNRSTIKSSKSKNSHNLSSTSIMSQSFFNPDKHQSSSQIISVFRREQRLSSHKSFINTNHYEKVAQLSNKTSKHNLQSSSISYLSMTPSQIQELEHNEHLDLIKKYTQTDELFLNKIKSDNKENMTLFCDSIRTLAKEFIQMVRLLVRIKLFLQCGNEIVMNMLSLTSKDLVLERTCHFLNCERATIYIYDHISDMLIVNSKEEDDQTKIAKNQGIIGHVFTNGEKIKIDDTSIDPRFRRDFEGQQLQHKTKNIVCYPLRNKKGEIFGVIEASNKQNKHFNNDDDELMIIYSTLTSILIENTSNNDLFNRQVLKYEKLIKYSITIQSLREDTAFVDKTELFLKALFNSTNARLIWVKNSQLFHKTIKFPQKSNSGIVYYVIKKKKCYGCSKVKISKYYNNLVDIEASESLVTYPIMHNNDCIGIVQVCLDEQIDDHNEIPHEREMKLFNLIEMCINNWYTNNIHSLTHLSIN